MSSLLFPAHEIVTIPIQGSQQVFPVRRVYCVGQNYADHAREMGSDPTRQAPFFFCKHSDAQSIIPVQAGETRKLPFPDLTNNFHHEIELVVAIGKQGKNITVEQAADFILGYAVGLDMTRRDLQKALKEKGRPWEVAKAFDYSLPIAPLSLAKDVPNIHHAEISLNINEKQVQHSDISHLTWSITEVIANLSTYFELYPGDLIMTGTPAGVGAIERGDHLLGTVTGLTDLSVVYC